MAATLPYKLQQTTARVLVMLVLFQVLCQPVDALGQKSNLDLGRSGISGMSMVIVYNSILFAFRQRHKLFSLPTSMLARQADYSTEG